MEYSVEMKARFDEGMGIWLVYISDYQTEYNTITTGEGRSSTMQKAFQKWMENNEDHDQSAGIRPDRATEGHDHGGPEQGT